jgi:hypothetical protein
MEEEKTQINKIKDEKEIYPQVLMKPKDHQGIL